MKKTWKRELFFQRTGASVGNSNQRNLRAPTVGETAPTLDGKQRNQVPSSCDPTKLQISVTGRGSYVGAGYGR